MEHNILLGLYIYIYIYCKGPWFGPPTCEQLIGAASPTQYIYQKVDLTRKNVSTNQIWALNERD